MVLLEGSSVSFGDVRTSAGKIRWAMFVWLLGDSLIADRKGNQLLGP